MKTRLRRLSARTITAIHAEYSQGAMPFHPMAENKHWRDNRMYFSRGQNWFYQRALETIYREENDRDQSFWEWADKLYGKGDVRVVWCNVYRCHALHFVTDEAKLEFLLRHGKEEPFPLKGIMLPVMRRIVPSLIAHDILSVQPMTTPPGLIFSTQAGFGMRIQKDDNDV